MTNRGSTSRRSRSARAAAAIALALAGAGCGAANTASQIRGDAPTVGDVLKDDHGGGQCQGVDKPLVVDADASLRGEIEVAMGKGIAIVAYDCKKIRILACKSSGEYTYAGFTTKQQTIQLENADEIRANLPLSGASIASKLEGELTKGVTLDIAMAMIGKKTSTAEVTQPMLSGPDCKEATHFVRGAVVGAFAMQTGAKAQVKAAADLLVGKVSAGSASGLKIDKKEGALEECLKATPDDPKPRSQCAGLIRLELVVLGKHGAAAAGDSGDPQAPVDHGKEPSPDVGTHSCPAGLRWADGKCGVPSAAQTHACKDDDFKDCAEQCDKGNGDSCNTLAVLYQRGGKDVKRDLAKAETHYTAACNRGVAKGCANLGLLYQWGGEGVAKNLDSFKNFEQKACDMGEAKACSLLAGHYWYSKVEEDHARSGPLYLRACNAGHAGACQELGARLNGFERDRFGKPFLGSQPAGIVFLGKACKAGLDFSCVSTADSYATGNGVTKDGLKALELYEVACERGHAPACVRIGLAYERGVLNKDDAKAASYYKKACELKTPQGKPTFGALAACVHLGRLHESGAGVGKKDELEAANHYKKACDTDDKYGPVAGCLDLARIYESGKGVPKNAARALELLQHGCTGGNAQACFVLGERYQNGKGLTKDEKKAAELYRRGCGTSPEACMAFGAMAAQGKGGLAKSEKEAAAAFLHGCSLGESREIDVQYGARIAQSCAKIAALEAAGKVVEQDRARAYMHFTMACERGDKPSCDQSKRIAGK